VPILRAVGAWLMERGISPGEPGWLFVPLIGRLPFPSPLPCSLPPVCTRSPRACGAGDRPVRRPWVAVAFAGGVILLVAVYAWALPALG
jgi:hypothetical protein